MYAPQKQLQDAHFPRRLAPEMNNKTKKKNKADDQNFLSQFQCVHHWFSINNTLLRDDDPLLWLLRLVEERPAIILLPFLANRGTYILQTPIEIAPYSRQQSPAQQRRQLFPAGAFLGLCSSLHQPPAMEKCQECCMNTTTHLPRPCWPITAFLRHCLPSISASFFLDLIAILRGQSCQSRTT